MYESLLVLGSQKSVQQKWQPEEHGFISVSTTHIVSFEGRARRRLGSKRLRMEPTN